MITNDESSAIISVLRQISQQGAKGVPFHRAIAWLPVLRNCSPLPRPSDGLRAIITSAISDPLFGVTEAGKLLDLLLREMMPESQLASITAVTCPLIESSCKEGQDVCPIIKPGPGCDELAGRTYFAKTDGFTVWFAAMMFERENRVPVNITGYPVPINSLAEAVLYHEFCHVMHLDPTTTLLFNEVQDLYWQAARLVPLELRRSGVFDVSHKDMLEFVAFTFGIEASRNDVGDRSC